MMKKASRIATGLAKDKQPEEDWKKRESSEAWSLGDAFIQPGTCKGCFKINGRNSGKVYDTYISRKYCTNKEKSIVEDPHTTVLFYGDIF